MKRLFASAIALMTFGFAYSQANIDVSTQLGNLNEAYVNQTGLLNVNVLTQDGNRNYATIDQVGAGNINFALSDGNRNNIDVDQLGVLNLNTVEQHGNRNSASTLQVGLMNSTIKCRSETEILLLPFSWVILIMPANISKETEMTQALYKLV